MARVSTYINTLGRTEEAFLFYESVFRSKITMIQRFSDFGDSVQLPDNERDAVLHVELPILAGHVLMGTDMLRSMGHDLRVGNNTSINLEPDTRAEADRLYGLLSDDSTEHSGGMKDMDWGAYWGSCLDRFGIRWMLNVTHQ